MIFYEEIFDHFQKNNINYVVVGGVAFNLLGGSRSTFDLDILIEMDDSNICKTIQSLLDLGYNPKQPVNPMDFAKSSIRNEWIKEKNMKAFNFYKSEKSLEEVDIIIDAPVDYNLVKDSMKIINVSGFRICVISIGDLIKMKEASPRDKDKLDLKELYIMKKYYEKE